VLKRGDVVIYESTVYPGCTEEFCVPILERASGLAFNRDFYAGYSPERINPGDKTHRLPGIRKVTSGSTPEIAAFVDQLYGSIITAGTHPASSIRVAEAAKVIENTQRDVNIALVNELAMIFNRLGIDTQEVLEAAGQQVELPAVPARPRRWPLHRRRPVLPDAQGAADRIPPRDDPRGPSHQRQHGAVRRRRSHAAHDREAHPRERLRASS
jgi:nucleotide sugar dehydrogenase